jgi:hypothetical protein
MPVKSLAAACVLATSAWAVRMAEQTNTFDLVNTSDLNAELAKLEWNPRLA